MTPRWATRTLHGAGGALVSFAAAVGILVGTRSVVAVELPGVRSLLRLGGVPREHLGLDWSPRALWPVELQDAAVERLAGLLAALFLLPRLPESSGRTLEEVSPSEV